MKVFPAPLTVWISCILRAALNDVGRRVQASWKLQLGLGLKNWVQAVPSLGKDG